MEKQKFYVCGFMDVERAWNHYGHVLSHEIFLTRSDADAANKG